MKNTAGQFISFTADRYYWSTLKRPSGWGCWAFRLSGNGSETYQFLKSGKYSEVKKIALVMARDRNFTLVEVLP